MIGESGEGNQNPGLEENGPHCDAEVLPSEVTQLLQSWTGGDRDSFNRLFSLLHEELKRIARRAGAAPDDTMQATVIVNEFYLRLLGHAKPKLENRAHFFSLAARVMRQIRIDHARRNAAGKRGGDFQFESLDLQGPGRLDRDDDTEALHEGLTRLEGFDPRKAAIVDLRYFAGLSVQEVASAFEVSTETVRKELRLAEAWLMSYLGHCAAPPASR